MSPISIAFVDDHPILLDALTGLFAKVVDRFNVLAVGVSAEDVIAIASKYTPDVLIVDLSMPGDVFQAIGNVLLQGNGTKVLAFTASTSTDQAIRTLEAGATGYVLKGSSLDELMIAISAVHSGETYITPSFALKVVEALRNCQSSKSGEPRNKFEYP